MLNEYILFKMKAKVFYHTKDVIPHTGRAVKGLLNGRVKRRKNQKGGWRMTLVTEVLQNDPETELVRQVDHTRAADWSFIDPTESYSVPVNPDVVLATGLPFGSHFGPIMVEPKLRLGQLGDYGYGIRIYSGFQRPMSNGVMLDEIRVHNPSTRQYEQGRRKEIVHVKQAWYPADNDLIGWERLKMTALGVMPTWLLAEHIEEVEPPKNMTEAFILEVLRKTDNSTRCFEI